MNNAITPFEALEKAVDIAGSQAAIARLCGVSQPSVWKWLQSSKRLPAEHVLTVEAETGISRHILRPDIYPRNYPPAPDCRFIAVDTNAARHIPYPAGVARASGNIEHGSPSHDRAGQ